VEPPGLAVIQSDSRSHRTRRIRNTLWSLLLQRYQIRCYIEAWLHVLSERTEMVGRGRRSPATDNT
jgi:hypothetical protein